MPASALANATSLLTSLAPEEQQVLADWIAFIKSGFELEYFTKPLYRHLANYAILETHGGLEAFWHEYFNRRAFDFRAILNQFGGSLTVAEASYLSLPITTPWWDYFANTESVVSLNLAMIEATQLVYSTLIDHLDGMLETMYEAHKLEVLTEEYRYQIKTGGLSPDVTLDEFLTTEGEYYERQVYYDNAIEDYPINADMRRRLARAISGWSGPRIAAPQSAPERIAPQQDLFVLYDWRKARREAYQPGVENTRQQSQPAATRQRLTASTMARRRRLAAKPEVKKRQRQTAPEEDRYANLAQ